MRPFPSHQSPLPPITLHLYVNVENGRETRTVHFIPTRTSSITLEKKKPPKHIQPNTLLSELYAHKYIEIGDHYVNTNFHPSNGPTPMAYIKIAFIYFIYFLLFTQSLKHRFLRYLMGIQKSNTTSLSSSSTPSSTSPKRSIEITKEWKVPKGTNEVGARAVLLGFDPQIFCSKVLNGRVTGIDWRCTEDEGLKYALDFEPISKCPKQLWRWVEILNRESFLAAYNPEELEVISKEFQNQVQEELIHNDTAILPFDPPVNEDSHNLQYQEIFYSVQFLPLSLRDRLNLMYSCKMLFRIMHATTIMQLKSDPEFEDDNFNHPDTPGCVDTRKLKLIHIFAARDNAEGLKIVLRLGVDKNEPSGEKRQTPLHLACAHSQERALRILAFYGANINSKDSSHETPLHAAMQWGVGEYGTCPSIAMSLLFLRPQVNIPNLDGETPVAYNRIQSDTELLGIERFLKLGADMQIKNNKGVTMKEIICQNREYSCPGLFKLLEKYESKALLYDAVCTGAVKLVCKVADENPQTINAIARDGQTPLHKAIRRGHTKIIKELVNRGADVNVRSLDGETPLHFAAQNSAEAIPLLIGLSSNIEAQDDRMRTPLHTAANFGDEDSVRELLRHGANIHALDETDSTPLHLVCHVGCARALLEAGAERTRVNKQGRNVLHVAADGEPEILEEFLKVAQIRDLINSIDNEGNTPLHIACGRKSSRAITIVTMLLDNGADIDFENLHGSTPLIVAARKGKKKVVNALLERGADVNHIDVQLFSPLVGAVMQRKTSIVNELLTRGARIYDQNMQLVLHLAIIQSELEMVDALLGAGSNLNLVCSKYNTPLHYAASSSSVEILKLLLRKGADAKKKNEKGRTPLHLAAERNHVDKVEVLLNNQVSANETDLNGQNPLHRAASKGHVQAVAKLAKAVKNINAKTKQGVSALHMAAVRGKIGVVKELVRRGAKVEATTLHEAAEKGHTEVVAFLLEHVKKVDLDAVEYTAEREGHIKVVVAIRAWRQEKNK